MIKHFFFSLVLLLSCPLLQAQEAAGINLRDAKGRPDGLWYIKQPARLGEPAFTELGTYVHGRKYGVWHQINSEGDLVASQRYNNNVLNGESRYYEQGRLATTGNFRGLNPDYAFDTLWVKDPITHEEKKVVISTERGSLRHGLWQYFDVQTGKLLREEEYQVDELIYAKNYTLPKGDSTALIRRTAGLPHNAAKPVQPSPKGERLLRR